MRRRKGEVRKRQSEKQSSGALESAKPCVCFVIAVDDVITGHLVSLAELNLSVDVESSSPKPKKKSVAGHIFALCVSDGITTMEKENGRSRRFDFFDSKVTRAPTAAECQVLPICVDSRLLFHVIIPLTLLCMATAKHHTVRPFLHVDPAWSSVEHMGGGGGVQSW